MITGLPDAGIKESCNRIHVAITNNHFTMPRTKLVINLVPADVRKAGTAFDLPIAIGILIASGQFESAICRKGRAGIEFDKDVFRADVI